MEYLRQVISIHKVLVELARVNVVEWPITKNVKGVCGFLSITGYYKKFIKKYSKIARSLVELTKKDGLGGVMRLLKN